MDSPGSSVHGILQATILEWVNHALLRGIFPTQGSNLGLLHCGQILYHLSHQGTPGHLPQLLTKTNSSRNLCPRRIHTFVEQGFIYSHNFSFSLKKSQHVEYRPLTVKNGSPSESPLGVRTPSRLGA